MKRLFFLFFLLAGAAPAVAADRSISVTDFDRVRVEGPYTVHLATRGTPSARIAGSRAAADGVEIRVDGTTLVVRAAGQGAGERAKVGTTDVPVITLRAPMIQMVTVVGGAQLDVTGPLRGARVDLQITGSGTIAANAIEAEQLNVAAIGAGTMALGGRAARARLLGSGTATIEAPKLQVDTLVLRLDGTGGARVGARYQADVATTGPGGATVYGKARCSVKSATGGPIACGVPLPATPEPAVAR